VQQRSEETRHRLINAAGRLFAQTGYDATGVAEICAAAGVSKGAFYHHFPTKHAVFVELLDSWLSGLDQGMELIRTTQTSVPEALVQMASVTQIIFQDADQHLPMFLEFWRQASKDPQVWQATIAPYHRYRTYFAALIQQGIDEGSLRPVDPEATARTIVALAVGLLLQGLLDPQGADWPAVSQESLALLVSGLKKDRVS
jgi:AcrR family transcriptional regulator